MKTSKPLKTIEAWLEKNAHLIDEYWIEYDEFGSGDGLGPYSYWIYLDYGFRNTLDDTHCIHEATARDIKMRFSMIERCFCDRCLEGLAEKREQRQKIYES